jgi:hypothetical protein
MDSKKIIYQQYKDDCKKVNTWCPNCKHKQDDEWHIKGVCGVRDRNGLTPNQMLYGNK